VSAVTYADLGPLVVNVDVDEMVINWLRVGFPFHVRWLETERNLGTGFLADPKTFSSTLDDNEFPDLSLPALYVTSAETSGAPMLDAGASYGATWRVRVSCVSRGQNGTHTRRLASYSEGIVRRIMLAPQDEFDGEVRWLSTTVAPVYDRSGAGRYLAAGIADYAVYMDEVVRSSVAIVPPAGGPYPPPGDPTDPLEPLVPISTITTEVRPK
jgi:hypothetical protein